MRRAGFVLLILYAWFQPGLTSAQQVPDEFQVAIRFDDGRFVTRRETARLMLSDQFRKLLRPGITDEELIRQFSEALDRQFERMPKPYFYTLTDAQRELDLAGDLDDPEVETRRDWNGSIAAFPGLAAFQLDRTNPRGFNEQLEAVRDHSALSTWLNPEDRIDGALRFAVRAPLIVDELEIPRTGMILDRDGVVKRLRPLNGRPANPEAVVSALLDFYIPRGLTPRIDLQLDGTPRTLSIFESGRIARILLPADLADFARAQMIVYEALPHRVFTAFRKRGAEILAEPLDPEATKREIDIEQLIFDTEPEEKAETFELPPLDGGLLGQIQQRLLALEYTASVFEFNPGELLVDLVIDPTTPQSGAGSEANPFTGTAVTAPNSPAVTSRPGAAPDVQPQPVRPVPPNGNQPSVTPREQDKNYVGGGFEYRPGQGVRALATYQRINTLGLDLFAVELGGAGGGGFASARYSRDYLFFGQLGRRLGGSFSGGTEFERQRILGGVLTNERRTGASLRIDLELFRDRNNRQLSLFFQGRRETVRLTAVQSASAPESATSQNIADVGLVHQWRRSLSRRPFRLRIEPALRFGIRVQQGEPSFQRFTLSTQYHQSVAGPVEIESRFVGATAGASTPLFELPSLGGSESVRGFRGDENIGQHLWAFQNELWFPVTRNGVPSGLHGFISRNVRLAFFHDAGNVHKPPAGTQGSITGLRQGAGLGLRVRYQGVVIEADWAYGFGSSEASRPGRGRFYFNFRLP
jgi:hypothetical protein